MDMNLETVLRAWRHHEELSQRDAAARIGLAATTYRDLEMGRFGKETLARVIQWLLDEPK